MFIGIASSCPLPEFPSETWLNIFRLFETNISVNIVELELFCSSDSYQSEAFEKVYITPLTGDCPGFTLLLPNSH